MDHPTSQSWATDSRAPPNEANSRTALATTTKSNLSYLINPSSAEHAPTRFRTRALLRSLRYISIFIFWRVIRYAKYALVGSLTAAIAGTAIGSVASGAAFVIAPPGILAGAGVGLLWGVGKFGWRILASRIGSGSEDGADPRKDEKADAGEEDGLKKVVEEREVKGLRSDPW